MHDLFQVLAVLLDASKIPSPVFSTPAPKEDSMGLSGDGIPLNIQTGDKRKLAGKGLVGNVETAKIRRLILAQKGILGLRVGFYHGKFVIIGTYIDRDAFNSGFVDRTAQMIRFLFLWVVIQSQTSAVPDAGITMNSGHHRSRSSQVRSIHSVPDRIDALWKGPDPRRELSRSSARTVKHAEQKDSPRPGLGCWNDGESSVWHNGFSAPLALVDDRDEFGTARKVAGVGKVLVGQDRVKQHAGRVFCLEPRHTERPL
mmetsp:Transcript_11398/g.32831  ORF Transcript_11398/g.32831 Transcript_11398/m.32831 type:complete len:257 (+) Transcript_11398:593-1363(+)